MKKIIALFLASAILFALSACTNDSESTSTNESSQTTSTTESTTTSTPVSSEVSSADNTAESSEPSANNSSQTNSTQVSKKYAEDLNIKFTYWTFGKLEYDLQMYVTTNEFTYGTPPTFTYDLRHKFEKYSILGYFYPDDRNTYEYCIAEVESKWLTDGEGFEDDNNEEISKFTLDFNIPYQTSEFVRSAVERDIQRMNEFFDQNYSQIIFDNVYSSFEDIPEEKLEELYNGTATSPLTIVYGDGCSLTIQTRNNGELLFRSLIVVTF